MTFNSTLFDRIRVKPADVPPPREDGPPCAHPGCNRAGEYRAPMGRLHEGQYFCFCLDHVREYNATYNYFAGMTDEAVAKYQQEAIVGHRPTWSMGVNRAAKGFREDGNDPNGSFVDPMGLFRNRRQAREPERPRHSAPTMKALDELGLDETATKETVKARYKELVKRLHPDANGGDRSGEDKLREIVRAYNYLKSVKLA